MKIVFKRFMSWLGGGKSLQELVINLKLTDRRLERHKKKLKNNLYKKLREKYTITFELRDDKGESILAASETKAVTEQKR